MRIRRSIITALAALAAAPVLLLASGCSSGQLLSYAPAAYGIPGHCYYVDDPAEAYALQAAGLCPSSWVATLMPLAWHEQYWDYYDSAAYYDVYVPVSYRTVYTAHETAFGHTYRTTITTLSRSASYRSSSGTLVRGSRITAKTRFGSGTSFGTPGQRFGGGSLRIRHTRSTSSRRRG